MEQPDNLRGGYSSYFYPPYCYPAASVIAHNQQSTSVEAGHVTVNTSAFAGEPRHERDASGRTVPIRVINPDKRSEYKTYTLRNLTGHSFADLGKLKGEITSQLGEKVSSDPDFSVGYYKGQTRFWIRDDADVKYVGTIFNQGNACTLWCDAASLVPQKRKQRRESADSSDEQSDSESKGKSKKKKMSAMEERKEHVEEVKSELREKHGASYTPLQYTLWAEMVAVGTHKSLEDPPQVQMFTGKSRKQKPESEMSTVFTELAKSVVNVLSPQALAHPPTTSGGVSPNKLADIRSKYIQQMRELHSLYELGALTESEFQEQKKPILLQLKKFTPQV